MKPVPTLAAIAEAGREAVRRAALSLAMQTNLAADFPAFDAAKIYEPFLAGGAVFLDGRVERSFALDVAIRHLERAEAGFVSKYVDPAEAVKLAESLNGYIKGEV